MSVARLTCEHCGKRLRPWRFGVTSARPHPAHVLVRVLTVDGRPPKLGAHGCNAFCSVRCGFDWAVRRLLRDVGGES